MTAKCYVCGSEDDLVYYEWVTLKTKGNDVTVKGVCVCKKCQVRVKP